MNEIPLGDRQHNSEPCHLFPVYYSAVKRFGLVLIREWDLPYFGNHRYRTGGLEAKSRILRHVDVPIEPSFNFFMNEQFIFELPRYPDGTRSLVRCFAPRVKREITLPIFRYFFVTGAIAIAALLLIESPGPSAEVMPVQWTSIDTLRSMAHHGEANYRGSLDLRR